jgi:hypothetical protein
LIYRSPLRAFHFLHLFSSREYLLIAVTSYRAHKSLNPASRAPIQRTLSEYSEGSDASSIYSSDDDYGSSTAPSTSHTTSATSSAKSYAQYIQKDDEQSRRNKGLLEEDEEELDPFADPVRLVPLVANSFIDELTECIKTNSSLIRPKIAQGKNGKNYEHFLSS